LVKFLHPMRGAAVEGIADGVLIGQEAIGADLRGAQHALAKLLHEQVQLRRPYFKRAASSPES
jgi:hypothetical protein